MCYWHIIILLVDQIRLNQIGHHSGWAVLAASRELFSWSSSARASIPTFASSSNHELKRASPGLVHGLVFPVMGGGGAWVSRAFERVRGLGPECVYAEGTRAYQGLVGGALRWGWTAGPGPKWGPRTAAS